MHLSINVLHHQVHLVLLDEPKELDVKDEGGIGNKLFCRGICASCTLEKSLAALIQD
jgi:hypothetical protein